MPELADQIAEAEATLAALKRRAQFATCQQIGCNMESVGGANCGCEFVVEMEGGETSIVPGCLLGACSALHALR